VLRGCCVDIYINRPVPTVRILNMIQEEPEVKIRIIGIIENKVMGGAHSCYPKIKSFMIKLGCCRSVLI